MTAETAGRLSVDVLRQRGSVGDVPAADLSHVRAVAVERNGEAHTRIAQTHGGVPVFGGEVIVHLKADGSLKSLTDGLVHGLTLSAVPALTRDQAIDVAVQKSGGWPQVSSNPRADLQVLRFGRTALLTWRVRLEAAKNTAPRLPVVFVNASSGDVVWSYDNLQTAKNRIMHSANHGTTLPGTLMRSEGQAPIGETDVDTNYDRLGTVYDCYHDLFGRDSWDNAGATFISSVHFSTNYVNAYWNGTQMVYGDGDGVNSRSLAISMDVTAHELTHAVTETSSGLIYSGESGGLNEAMSDIFGNTCEWYRDNAGDVMGPTSANTWMVAEDVWLAAPALRFMNDPARDGASLDYYSSSAGSVDVHYSSGIANLAFYLLANGGTHPRGRSTTVVTGIGIHAASRIFYRANTAYLTPSSGFPAARAATVSAAVDLFGAGSVEATQAANAWLAVGVAAPVQYTVLDTQTVSGALSSQTGFSYATPANATAMKFDIAGGTGDADLYVRFGSAPTLTQFDCRPYIDGNVETCEFNPSQSGTYHVMLVGYAAYTNVVLTTRSAGGLPATETSCTDAIDNDGDGAVDCADSDCTGNTACLPATETSCTDGIDNDGDGAIDCADSDCTGNTACLPTTETSCNDGIDNDGDGAIDCADSDCAGNTACLPTTETSCTDGIDNDGDGALDCADMDCAGNPVCVPAKVIINEVLANEPGSSTAGEFVELVNLGGQPIDISGWTLSDATLRRHTFAAGTFLAGHQSIVVYGGAGAIPAGVPNAIAASTGQLNLANSGDRVVVRSGASVVDSVTYSGSLASKDGVSMNRRPDATAGAAFALHTVVQPGTNSSPGRRANGSPF